MNDDMLPTQDAAPAPAPAPEVPRPPHVLDILTGINSEVLDRTGRVSERTRDRAAAFMTSAMGVGYPHNLFAGTKAITGKVLRKQRLKVLRWLRENRPDLVARGEALREELTEPSES